MENLDRYYGFYSNASRGLRQKEKADGFIPGVLTWILGLPRLHRLPELRGPPEAQGVVRPLFGNRPPRFPFFPATGNV
jgi:hypothetical protein